MTDKGAQGGLEDLESQELQAQKKSGQVTEAQVKAALRQDKGSKAHLLSWTTEDLTKKGDNLMCTVKRLNVSFSLDGQNFEVSYVVKAKQAFEDGLRDFANLGFEKECLFYSILVPLLNAELESASLEPLRLPRYNFHSLDENGEVLIMEDVSQLGFKMVDSKNGLDAAHAELVFLELARLHAASCLLQANLPSGNLAEEYSFLMKDWSNYSERAETEIGQLIQNDINILVKVIETVDGYEEVLTWLKNLAPRSMDVFKEQLKMQAPFAVLCHGDCWTNNFLFRYDDTGRPIDVILLDMQWCRRGSPALDLNTVVYASISGEVRAASFSQLLHAYFSSFTSVMKTRNASVPFTYDELLQEYHKRNIFGLLMGTTYMTVGLADADCLPEFIQAVDEKWMKQREKQIKTMVTRSPLLLTWMCSMLDDMVEFGVVGNGCQVANPVCQKLQVQEKPGQVTEAQVKAALRQDKGSKATLRSWATEDLTKKGDNFMCTVKRLNVSFSQDGQNFEVSYVVKAKQAFEDGLRDFANMAFEKECLFYSILLPMLNAELESASLEPLRLPRYNFHSLDENGEVLIMEDVSQLGFKMVDRKIGLDAAHAELVFLELARLHAASCLLQASLTSGNLAEEYSFLMKDWDNYSEGAEMEIGLLVQSDMNILVKVIETVDGYEEVLTWLKDLAPRSMDIFKEQIKAQDPFAVFCHGDCWTNNFLFRYDDAGRPVDVVLLDMQMCRRGSPALDLNTVVYSSISGEVRAASFMHLLQAYFSSFTSIMKARDAGVTFTYDELLQEYHKRNIFGLLVAASYLPTALVDADDTPDYTQAATENWMKQREEKVKTLVARCPLLVTWMCSVVDDMVAFGVVGNGCQQADLVCQRLQAQDTSVQVTEAQVKAALRQNKGSKAHLLSWTTEEFTKKGDNFMCTVKRLNVSFSQDGQNFEVSYVVKAKQAFEDGLRDFANMAFEKECLFYSILVPLLNAELESASLEPLRLPRYNFHSLDENGEVLIMEDVSQLGFKMVDSKNGLDAAHAELVFLELARLHAASCLLQANLTSGNLAEEYSFLMKDWSNYSEGAETEIGQVMQNDIYILVKVIETVDGYEEVLTWLKDLAPRIMDVFKEQLKTQDPFAVLCHGDCWSGNFLFRYDDAGRPVDVVLLDVQMCRRGSPALDLNTVVYASISGEVRAASFSHLLQAYFSSFTSVMEARNAAAPFTYDELLQEYHKRNIFGLMQAASVLPTTLVDADDIIDPTQVGEEWMKQREEKVKSMVARNPLLATWMCSMLDDMLEFGVVEKGSH